MLVSFDVVQRKYCLISGRQLRNRLVEGDPVYHRHGVRIFRPFDYLNWGFAVLGGLLQTHPTLAKVHQNLIHRQPMQPGSESRFPAKTAYFAKELNKYFLRQILGFGHIPGHPQAERIYASVVTLVKLFEGFHVSFGSFLRQLVIRRSGCLGFVCCHLLCDRQTARNETSITSKRDWSPARLEINY